MRKKHLLLILVAVAGHVLLIWVTIKLFQSPYPILAFALIAIYLLTLIYLPYKKFK